jgi:hypothetical protein
LPLPFFYTAEDPLAAFFYTDEDPIAVDAIKASRTAAAAVALP